MKKLPISESCISSVRLAGWTAAIMAAAFVGAEGLLEGPRDYKVSIFALVVFGGPAVYCFHQIRVLHRATICYNGEGLWFERLGKEKGLIRWLDIKSTRDREAVQRLELLDRQGKVLIGLEHQLEGYGSLKKMIYTKLRGPNPQVDLPITFGRSVILQNLCIGISLFGAAISIVAMISDHLNGRDSDHISWGDA